MNPVAKVDLIISTIILKFTIRDQLIWYWVIGIEAGVLARQRFLLIAAGTLGVGLEGEARGGADPVGLGVDAGEGA